MSYKDFLTYFPDFTFLENLFLLDLIKYKKWSKGEFICHSNSQMDNLYFFTSGRGRVYKLLNNGKEVMYDFYEKGQIAGDVEYILNAETTCSLESSDNLSAYVLAKSIITPEIHNKLFVLLSKEVAKKLVNSSIKNSIKLSYTLEERLAHYLVYSYKHDLKSMNELATNLGTTYRHLSRIFKKMETDNLLILDNKKITILNKQKLTRICEQLIEDLN